MDFVIRSKKNVIVAIECKMRAKAEQGNLNYFHKTFHPQESICVVEEPGIFRKEGDVFVVSIELLAMCLS